MFAGAAREAVFSDPAVVRRIAAGFVPVALKAGLVDQPPPGPEGALYAAIRRTRPAPQGICVLGPDGRPRAWALSFDDAPSVPGFLDHAASLSGDAVERYLRYPGGRLADAEAPAGQAPPPSHREGEACPARPRAVAGSLVVRVVGRALDADGRPHPDVRSQERYVEDVFAVAPAALALPRGERVPLPDALARALVAHAYLGQLDVRCTRLTRVELWVDGDGLVTGESESGGGDGAPRPGDRATFTHAVKLSWRGRLEVADGRVTGFVLMARGRERLTWGNPRLREPEPDVAHLMAGRAIDFDGEVVYGFRGRPVAEEASYVEGEPGAGGRGPPPDSLRRKMERLQEALRATERRRAEVARVMRDFGALMQDGRYADAEALLDDALALLEE